MDLLLDADEYVFVKNHVDAVYHNGKNQGQQRDTSERVRNNIAILSTYSIKADTKPEYLDDWFFIR